MGAASTASNHLTQASGKDKCESAQATPENSTLFISAPASFTEAERLVIAYYAITVQFRREKRIMRYYSNRQGDILVYQFNEIIIKPLIPEQRA